MTLQQKILSHFATYDNFNPDDVVEVLEYRKHMQNPHFRDLRKRKG